MTCVGVRNACIGAYNQLFTATRQEVQLCYITTVTFLGTLQWYRLTWTLRHYHTFKYTISVADRLASTEFSDTRNIPQRFDARERWPRCPFLHIPTHNQGECGSCYVSRCSFLSISRTELIQFSWFELGFTWILINPKFFVESVGNSAYSNNRLPSLK